MNLFFRLFSRHFGAQRTGIPNLLEPHNNSRVAPKCPHCSVILKKIPRAKTKCPFCENFMYVRTRYSDKAQVVVTQQQADEIEEDWEVASMVKSMVRWYGSDYIQERDILREKFGKEPSGGDVLWRILNGEIIKHTTNGDWGSYRNTRFEMAGLLRGERKYRQALTFYLEVFYLDQNEVLNAGEIRDNSLEPQKRVDAEVVDHIQLMSKKLNIDGEEVERIYLARNREVQDSLGLSVVPEKALGTLKALL